MSRYFTKNVELWAKEQPLEALQLQHSTESAYRRINRAGEAANLKMPWGPLYEENPSKEASKWFQTLKLDGIRLLYVYGVGLGAYYFALKNWLSADSERHVVFFEDDPAVMKRFLEQENAQELLSDPQATVCFLKELEDSGGVLETLYWSFVMIPFQTSALESYAKHKSDRFEAFRYKISYSTTMKNALVDEYLRYGVGFFRNFYPNILELHSSYWGNALFGKFPQVPAIICGAGPSLEKQIELLGTLKNRALIFAGGSSLNAISAKSILPHFGAGIDPNPTQYMRLASSQAYEVPFFYRSRMLHDAFMKIRGPRLYISGAGGYDIAEWYEEKWGISSGEFLDEGHNVVNFCTEIACRLGCNPLIYIGMDLAFTDMKAYSGGIEEKVEVSQEALLSAEDEEFRGIWRKDIYGKPILTLWKWVAEADWLAAFAKSHPDTTFINATEGGIGFPGIAHSPFKEAARKHLKKSYDLIGRVHGEIQQAALPSITEDKLISATRGLKESLKKCVENIDILRQELAEEKKSPDTSGTARSGRAALAETDLFDEPAYQYVLDIFHQVYARVQNKKIVRLRVNKNAALTPREVALEKIELQMEKLLFLRNVAEANSALIDYAFKERKNAAQIRE
jgi:hypothetical protein